jgi:hypothetical protein
MSDPCSGVSYAIVSELPAAFLFFSRVVLGPPCFRLGGYEMVWRLGGGRCTTYCGLGMYGMSLHHWQVMKVMA